MASGTESRPYMDKVAELRKKFLDKHYASDKNYYDSRDIARVKSEDLFVQQYLAGRDGNVEKAHKLMVEALKWRKDFGINDLSEKDISEEVLKSCYIYTYGKDKNGAHSVYIKQANFVKGNKDQIHGYKKLFAFTFEKIQREHPGDRLSLINNAKNAGLSNVDNDYVNFISFIQKTAYPDILGNCYLMSLPVILQGIWKMFKGLLGSKMSSKYILTTAEELSQYIDKDQLPLEYGGPSFEYKYPRQEKIDNDNNETGEVISS